MNSLLHEDLITTVPIIGERIKVQLAARAAEVALASEGITDPSVSIVIRSRNNVAGLEALLDDIDAQEFTGEKEVILVDTESSDGTTRLARRRGATIVPIRQADFSYPKSLNMGFRAANHSWIFSFVDHVGLSNTLTLRTATRYSANEAVGGAFGALLPNSNATWVERLGTLGFYSSYFSKSARPAKPALDFLATVRALIRREAWEEVGGFDEAYGAGGEDGALGRALLRAEYTVMHEPALSVHHSHGSGPVNGLRELAYWASLSYPRPFSRERLTRHRPNLR